LLATATYTSGNEQAVDMAAADIYLYLMNHPGFSEGSKRIDYNPGALMALRNALLAKWGVTPLSISVPMDARYNKLW
jgi:hypothetical protein